MQSINFDTLQKDARKYLIDMLVSNRLYEKAYDMAMEYGIDMLAAASQVVLCENALKVQHVDDDLWCSLPYLLLKQANTVTWCLNTCVKIIPGLQTS